MKNKIKTGKLSIHNNIYSALGDFIRGTNPTSNLLDRNTSRQLWVIDKFSGTEQGTQWVTEPGGFLRRSKRVPRTVTTPKAYESPSGKKVQIGDNWTRYSYWMPTTIPGARSGTYVSLSFIVPPNIASEIDTYVSRDIETPSKLFDQLFPEVIGEDPHEKVVLIPPTEIGIIDRRVDTNNRTPEVKPLPVAG